MIGIMLMLRFSGFTAEGPGSQREEDAMQRAQTTQAWGMVARSGSSAHGRNVLQGEYDCVRVHWHAFPREAIAVPVAVTTSPDEASVSAIRGACACWAARNSAGLQQGGDSTMRTG